MAKQAPTNEPGAAGEAAKEAATEPRNVAVTVLKKRTKIGKAICARGPLDFPLSETEAKALEKLGLVKITGLFA